MARTGMGEALARIVALGVRADMSREDDRRVRLVNGLALAGIAFVGAANLGQGQTRDAVALAHGLVTIAPLAGVLLLHRLGRPRDAALLFHFGIIASIAVGSQTFGFDSGNFYYLILMAALPFLLFPSREQTAAFVTALVAVSSLVAIVFGWDLDGDHARRMEVYGSFQLVHQGTLMAVTVLVGYGSRSLGALAEADLGRELAKSERLLKNVFPEAIGRRLEAGEEVVAERFGDASVLFCTVIGAERLAAELAPEEFLARLHGVFSRMERRCAELGAEKIKTTGSTFIAAAGLPVYRPDHAEALVALGLRLQEEFAPEEGIRLRVGVNSGPVVAGVIGQSRPVYDIWGDAVNVAQRMEMHGGAGEVHISPSTFARVQHGFECVAREGVEVKGKGAMKTHVVRGPRGEPP